MNKLIKFLRELWRPLMGYVYMATCIADFIVFPALWNISQLLSHSTLTEWQPITLGFNGFYHVTFCSVIGIAAYGRTKEKLAGVADTTKA
jgi:hypothetical protein